MRDLVLGAVEGSEWTAADIARSFARAKPADVEAMLDSFAALGQLLDIDQDGARRYRRLARAAA